MNPVSCGVAGAWSCHKAIVERARDTESMTASDNNGPNSNAVCRSSYVRLRAVIIAAPAHRVHAVAVSLVRSPA
jgi:hypothetical protein